MATRRGILSLLLTGLVLAPGPTAWATHLPAPWPVHDRIYLMGADSDYLYWTVDPGDPELDDGLITRECGATVAPGVPGHSSPCLAGGLAGQARTYSMFFLPGSLFRDPVSWSPANPLQFHLELDVDTMGEPFDVKLVLQKGTSLIESPAATEVSPGVYEGTLGGGAPVGDGAVTLFLVRVSTMAPRATMRLEARGSSWIQLPASAAARSVPEMRTASAYAPQRTSFRSQTRAIEFNDADWEARSFSGDLAQTRTFPLTVDRPAVTTIAWAEAFDDSFGHSVLGGDPDVRRATDGVALRLLDEAGEEVEHTGGPYFGLGTASFALTGLDPGSYTLEVSGLTRTDEPLPFSVHLVTTHGARTLRSMRWRFFQQDNLRLPLIGVCPASLEAVPVSAEVSTFHVDLDWDTHAPGLPGWTVRFGLPGVGEFPCGEAGNGDWIRLTVPGTDVWYFGATPSRDRAFVSAFDTVFEMEVGFEYTPLPPEHP